MEGKKIEPEKIHIVDFKIVRASIDSPWDYELSAVKLFHSEVKFEIGFDVSNLLARTNFIVDVKTDDINVNTEEAKASFEFIYIFEIENLAELIEVNINNEIEKTDFGLQNALASITYSTSRGVLMSRLQGTIFSNFILPVSDPNKLFAQ